MSAPLMKKLLLAALMVALIAAYFLFDLGRYFSLSYLKESREQFAAFYADNTVLTIVIYMMAYIVVTALSLPGAAIMTLAAGAMFGFIAGVIVVSFASSIGATLACFVSRYLLRDWVNRKFGDRLAALNAGIEKEGAFYLFTLRLIPVFPFWLINLLMGLTGIRLFTFYWVSQIGMLAGTMVYVNAGRELGRLDSLSGILSPGLIISFALLGLFPIAVKKIMGRYRNRYRKDDGPRADPTVGENNTGISANARGGRMKYDYHIVIIGAGSAGLVVASGGASMGARVALIEEERMGGDCLNTGCVPSKSFLRSAHLAAQIRESGRFGLSARVERVDASRVMKRVHDVIREIAPHDSVERFTSLGVDVMAGRARLLDRHTVSLGDRTLTGKFIVIATGSRPAVPPIPGLADVPFLTNRNIFDIRRLPKKLIVLGGGPMGLELGQGFRHLGSEVAIIDMAPRLFPNDDAEVAPLMEAVLRGEGIGLELSATIKEVKKSGKGITVIIEKDGATRGINGSHLLVSLGRRPVTADMGLEETDIRLDAKGYIGVNRFLQTSVENIYACGDVVGPYQFTHMAGYQAGVVLRNIILPLYKSAVDYSAVPWTTYTRPEVAHVGHTESGARASGILTDTIKVELRENDRARTEGESEGFLKLVLGKKGRVIGATMVGNRAGEIIPLASMAIRGGMKSTAFLGQIFSYPTQAEIFKSASLASARKSFKPWMKSIVKAVLLR